jgi:hypothetical protein
MAWYSCATILPLRRSPAWAIRPSIIFPKNVHGGAPGVQRSRFHFLSIGCFYLIVASIFVGWLWAFEKYVHSGSELIALVR